MLLRLPIVVWDLLPDNAAYTFVGFVTSENTVSSVSQAEESTKERSAGDKTKMEKEVPADTLNSGLSGMNWPKSFPRYLPKYDGEITKGGGSAVINSDEISTIHTPVKDLSKSTASPYASIKIDANVSTKLGKAKQDEVNGRPLSLPRFLKTLDDSPLRSVLQTLCAQHPDLSAELIASVPTPSPAATMKVLKGYRDRLFDALSFMDGGSDYAYNRARQPLVDLLSAITDFTIQFLPLIESQLSISLEVLDYATEIIHELPEWDSQAHHHHKDSAYDEISKVWALVIKEAIERGAGFRLRLGDWGERLIEHNETSGGRMRSALEYARRCLSL